MSQFSCFVVGNGSAPLKCLEILKHAGHRVLGVSSSDSSLHSWAEKHHVPHEPSRKVFREQLLSTTYDYLFSINSDWILSAEVIAQASKGSINYHDSPLPKYAGLHATSWALLHGETQHAISWHEVTPKLDAGRIFKQKGVSIQPEDTAFSLNIRCFEAAVLAFSELVEELAENRVVASDQDLSQRSYFGLADRPEAACTLFFESPTIQLCRLVRALSFGPISNPLGLPKIWLPKGMIAVGTAKPSLASGTPGQVLSWDEQGLTIATGNAAVVLGQLTTLDGKPISKALLESRYGVQVGLVLPKLNARQREQITQQNSICLYESTWVKHLLNLDPFQHPYLKNEVLAPAPKQLSRYSIETLNASSDPKTVLACFAAYCARASTETEFDLALQTQDQRNLVPELFAQQVPLRVQVKEAETFAEFRSRFELSLDRTSKLQSYALDIFGRYPELRSYGSKVTLPCAVVLSPSLDALDFSSLNTRIAFIAYSDGSQPELVHQGELNQYQSEAIVEQLQILIRAADSSPEHPLHLLPLLSEQQRQEILTEWNQTEKSYPRNHCIHNLFTEQALKTPEALAVRFREVQLSYRELDRYGSQLAHQLSQLNVLPNTLVALCVPRSVELMIGLLGILKAGGAYIPIDPTYPTERIQYLISDSQASIVVTTRTLHQTFFDDVETVVYLDDYALNLAEFDPNYSAEVSAENLAYVIYTSGSTGRPKGVEISHRALINHSWAIGDYYSLRTGDRMLQSASISFDVAGEQIYPALFYGAAVVIRPDDLMESFSRFSKFIASELITAMILPTAFWHEWTVQLAESGQKVPASLKMLSVGTEKALSQRLEQWQSVSEGRVSFFQGYGPTETTITCTMYCHDGQSFQADAPLPIGRPLPNTKLYVLDQFLQPVPVGFVGELYIGGDGLSDGYLHRPELTTQKFVPSPFGESASKLYRTGDLVRYLPDSNLEFLDRRDNQVKIRGYRIELGEIEAALSQHNDIKDAVVILREDTSGDKRLVAYVVLNNQNPQGPALHSFTQQKLPSYMVPSAFIVLDALPLTNNGKVDRKALPAPNQRQPQSDENTLFLIPGGDGGKDELLKLARLFHFVDQERPIHGIQTRGIDGKQKTHTVIEEMAFDYAQEIRSIQPNGPYIVIGECIGGLVAYEVAQQLQKSGQEVALLALLDAALPTESRLQSFQEHRKLSTRLLEHVQNVLKLDPKQLLPYLFDKAKKTAVWLYPNLPDVTARSHYAKVKSLEAVLKYKPRSYSGSVLLLTSEEFPVDQLNVWKRLARELKFHSVPGSHDFYIRDNVTQVADILKSAIDGSLAPSSATAVSNKHASLLFINQSREKLVAPRDALESQLSEIFEVALGFTPIGVKDNIFDMGGDSLMILQIVSKIESSFGTSLPASVLFESATVERLAISLRKLMAEAVVEA